MLLVYQKAGVNPRPHISSATQEYLLSWLADSKNLPSAALEAGRKYIMALTHTGYFEEEILHFKKISHLSLHFGTINELDHTDTSGTSEDLWHLHESCIRVSPLSMVPHLKVEEGNGLIVAVQYLQQSLEKGKKQEVHQLVTPLLAVLSNTSQPTVVLKVVKTLQSISGALLPNKWVAILNYINLCSLDCVTETSWIEMAQLAIMVPVVQIPEVLCLTVRSIFSSSHEPLHFQDLLHSFAKRSFLTDPFAVTQLNALVSNVCCRKVMKPYCVAILHELLKMLTYSSQTVVMGEAFHPALFALFQQCSLQEYPSRSNKSLQTPEFNT